MNIIHTDIERLVKEIFISRFEMDLNNFNELAGKHFLGKEIGLAPRDLLYLFFDIEKEFDITIPEEDIVDGKFSTLHQVVEIIANQLEKKEKEVV